MSKVHFVHTSDWHLGFSQYNKLERYNDFREAAEKTVERIIQLKPQFVLHTGDIFHHANPKPADIIQAVRILSKLDDAEIPMFIIRGNHDGNVSKYLKQGGGIISLLKDLKLLEFIDDEIVYLKEHQAAILGVGHYLGNQVVSKIDQLMEEDSDFLHSDVFKIIGIHAYVEGQVEKHAQISLKKINTLGVHYLGAGHYHIPWKDEEKNVFAPGSVETTKITDAYRDDMVEDISMFSSFYEIRSDFNGSSWSELNVQTHKVSIRPKILLEYKSDQLDISGIEAELDQKIRLNLQKISEVDFMYSMVAPILSVTLLTDLPLEEVPLIDVEDWFGDQFLHVISNIDGKSNTPQISGDLGNSAVKEEVILELIKHHNLDPMVHTNMLIEILEQFGKYSWKKSLREDIVSSISDLLLQRKDNIPLDVLLQGGKAKKEVKNKPEDVEGDLAQQSLDEMFDSEVDKLTGVDN